ncbi:hypothetical protein EES42_04205 [Streptomyces sp. ADI95-17]|nr:hypothetical protein EES42_04205 [Streptomyces sp. ADI95-17]
MRHLACFARYFRYCHLHKKSGGAIDAPLVPKASRRFRGSGTPTRPRVAGSGGLRCSRQTLWEADPHEPVGWCDLAMSASAR